MAFVDPDAVSSQIQGAGGFVDPDGPAKTQSQPGERSLLGAGEAVATFVPKMFAGGLGGLAKAAGAKAGGATWGEAGQELQSGFEQGMEPYFTHPRATELQKQFMEALGHGVEKASEFIENMGMPSPVEYDTMEEYNKARSEYGDPEARLFTELAANFIPLKGGKMARDAVIDSGRRAEEARRSAEPAPEKFGFVDPDTVGPTIRNMPESETFRSVERGVQPEIPNEKRKADEFGYPTFEEFQTPEGAEPMREAPKLTERGVFEDQEPRRPTADNTIEYQRTTPEGANRALEADTPAAREAAAKPGFMRSAEEVMRARELERSQQSPAEGAAVQPLHRGEFMNEKLGDTISRHANSSSGKGVRAGLEVIAKESTSPYYRELSKKLLEDKTYNPDLNWLSKADIEGGKRAGFYGSKDYSINMHPEWKNSEHVFLHENIHARTHSVLETFRQHGELPKHMEHLAAPVRRLNQLFAQLKLDTYADQDFSQRAYELAGPDRPYGMTDIHEFVAEAFSNPEFQQKLAQLPLPKELKNSSLKTYWDSFVRNIGKMFGFDRKGDTYLSEVLRTGADLMTGTDRNDRTYFADRLNVHKDLGMELEPVKKMIEKKGVMGTAFEAVREHALDKRPIEEVIEKDLSGKLTDFTPESENLIKRAYDRLGSLVKENLLQDTTIALMMKNNAGTGPLIKWTVDQVSRIDRDYMIKTKAALDEGLGSFRKMFWSKEKKAELVQAMKLWDENIGVKELGREDFKTDAQFKVYENMQNVTKRVLKEMNDKRTAQGFKPIEYIPSYFHSMWEGDYRVFGFDGAGEKKWATGTKTEIGAEMMRKKLEKAHPELSWPSVEHVTRDKYGLSDLSAFEEAIRIMSKDDPVTKALQTTYREILQHRGFGRTGLHRKGILGFMGMEEGSAGLRNREKAFDQYINQAYRYLGNLDKQKVLEDLQKIPLDARKQVPQTMDFLYSYVHKARGAKPFDDVIGSAASALTKAIGVGESLPRNAVRGMSQIVTALWLTTPRFLLSQMPQSANAIPKLLMDHGIKDGLSAYFEGVKNTIQPDALSKEAVEWASKRQYLDPTIKNLIHKEINEVPSGNRFELVKEVAGWPAAYIEHHMVRTVAFNSFEVALRDTIKNKEARFEEAAQKADYYMVNYGRIHAPMVYDKMGIIGDAARPLKQYSHNYIGQFMEYASHAKNQKDYAPLASFFGVQIAVGGLKGALLVAEATIAVNLINAVFDTSIPTPEQLLLKSNLPDLLVFGGLSTALGVDISSSVAAPGLPSMLSFPPIEFTKNMMTDVGNFALKYLKGEETDHDRLKAWLAITPAAAHEYLRNAYTAEGQPTINPNDPQSRGNYRRSEDERLWTTLIGAKVIDESRADALVRNVKKELLRDLGRKTNAVDAIVDRVQNGQKIDPALFEEYIKNGGDPSRLAETVTSRMKERSLTGVERFQDHTINPQQIHRLEIMKDYLDKNTPLKSDRFDPKTGEFVSPSNISEERGVGGKRIYSDSEPPSSWKDRIVKGISNHPDERKMIKNPGPSQDNSIRDPSQRAKIYRT